MPNPKPCDAGYTDFLGAEYLRTISGRTTERPIGIICTPSDVDEWRNSIVRIRYAISGSFKRADEEKIKLPPGAGERITKWVFSSMQVPTGKFIPHGVSARVCKEDVANATDFGKRGVVLLAELHCALQRGGADGPTPPVVRPPVKELPSGAGIWFLTLGVVALLALAYLKPAKG